MVIIHCYECFIQDRGFSQSKSFAESCTGVNLPAGEINSFPGDAVPGIRLKNVFCI